MNTVPLLVEVGPGVVGRASTTPDPSLAKRGTQGAHEGYTYKQKAECSDP